MKDQQRGRQRIKEILGDKSETLIAMFESISPDFANYILEFAYGDLYSRRGMLDLHRELASVACLMGQGNTGVPLKAHMKGMLNVGCSKNDIIELILFLIGYVGFPTCVDAMLVLKQITDEE